MKKLRKVLALLLVVATLMGFTITATAANAFTDAETISKKEAVDLLSALDVIRGYETADGTFDFKPEGKVTRAEMAKMIYVIKNGGVDDGAKYFVGANTFSDVNTGYWAEGYIAYCAAEGIIDGYPDGTFRPNGNITVIETAKMVLCALGYTGFTGDTWAANVTKYARAKQLYTNINQLASAQATRETAAQILLNALQATTVTAEGGSSITINGVTITQPATFVDNANAWYVDAFEGQLTKVGAGNGAFGAPTMTWNYKGYNVVTTATPVASFSGAVSYNAIYNAIGAKVPVVIAVYEDGVTADNTAAVAGIVKVTKDNKEAVEATIGTAGSTTELYFDGTTLTIVVKNTYAGSVAISEAQAADKKCTITLKGAAATVYADVDNKVGMTDGSIVLFNLDNGAVKNMTAAKFITAALSGYTVTNDRTAITSITLGAKTYTLSEKAYGDLGTVEDVVRTTELGKDFNAWLDAAGNIIYIGKKSGTGTVTVTNYGYVVAKAEKTVSIWDNTSIAVVRMLTTEGKLVEVEVTDAFASIEVNALYKFSVDASSNKYTLGTAVDKVEENTTNAITNKNALITVNNETVIANLATIFVVETKANNVSTYKVYTGISAVPSYEAAKAVVDTKDGIAKVVYLMDATATAADPTTTATKLSMVLKTGEETFVTNADKKFVTTVNAIVDGAIVTMKTDDNAYSALSVGVNYIEGYVVDKGVVSGWDTLEGDEAVNLTVDVTYMAGIMIMNSEPYYVTTGIPAYIYNAKANVETLQVTNITALTTSFNGVAVIVDDAIVAVYGIDSI